MAAGGGGGGGGGGDGTGVASSWRVGRVSALLIGSRVSVDFCVMTGLAVDGSLKNTK